MRSGGFIFLASSFWLHLFGFYTVLLLLLLMWGIVAQWLSSVTEAKCHLILLPSYPLAILSSCHLILLPSYPLAILSSCHLILLPSYPLAILSSCHLILLPSYPLAILSSCHLILLPSVISATQAWYTWRDLQVYFFWWMGRITIIFKILVLWYTLRVSSCLYFSVFSVFFCISCLSVFFLYLGDFFIIFCISPNFTLIFFFQ